MEYKNIIPGDMPGDKIEIEEQHVKKAELIYPIIKEKILKLNNAGQNKVVVSVYGGSGVGKSEIASLLSYMLTENGLKSYTMSGDNYPYRIPAINDKKREEVYAVGGKDALKEYLATSEEINFEEVNNIISEFKVGKESIALKRMGRSEDAIWHDNVDMSDTDVLILEWTHGNSPYLKGIDIPVFLNSTPEETLEHRKNRNRDGKVDSPFTQMVLEIEQDKLAKQVKSASLIVAKAGEIISYDEYKARYGNAD